MSREYLFLKQYKMKNFKYLLIMFVGLTFAVSCADDDGVEKNSLIGSWGITESEAGLQYDLTVNFKANSTGTMTAVVSYEGERESSNESFTWSTDGNKLTMDLDGESQIATYSISGEKLSIIDDGETMVLTRQ